MKFVFACMALVLLSATGWNQCVVVGTAMPQPVSCADACDGQIVYVYQNTNMASPGAPYLVILEDGDGNTLSFQTHVTEIQTILFSGLCADTYSITVQGNACSHTTYAMVAAPTPVLVNANTTDPSLGLDNGICQVIASGGTSPYSYSLDGGVTFQTSNTFTGLAAGTYTALVMDANGCTESVDFTLTDNTTCSLVVTANPSAFPLCYGACTGSIQYAYFDASANNPYAIELLLGGVVQQVATNNSPNGSGSFYNLCAGVYTVKVTDAQGCIATYLVTIGQPSQLLINSVSTVDAAAGMNNGAATISATGGQPAYTYSLNGITWQASNIFTGLAAGVYVGYVKDSQGCISNYTFVIQENPGCFFNLTTFSNVSPSCLGSCDGLINYVFAGAPTDPPFSIVLESNGAVIQSATSPNQTVTGMFTGLCAGDYTLTVGNSAGCTEIVNVTLNQPPMVLLTASTVPATTGNSDGSITVTASGGSAPYQYSIDNQVTWQSGNTFGGLAAGGYIVWVQDANGCTSFWTVGLTETSACNFNITAMALPNSCAYSCNGSVIYSFNDPGNNAPYAIQLVQGTTVINTATWSAGGAGTGQFLNLCEGVFTLQITDADGCTDSETFYIDSPDPLVVTGVSVDNATAGNSDGSAEITLTGGTAPYQFSIDNGATWQSSNLLTGLSAGVYILQVEDANGCTTIYCFVVNEDPGCTLVVNAFEANAISCYGACSGAINYVFTSGAMDGPFTVTLYEAGVQEASATHTLPTGTGTFTNLCAGDYSVVVTNAAGCSSSAVNLTVDEPAEIAIDVSVTDASTGNSNGVAVVNASGGTGQYSYSLNGTDYQSSNVFDTLAAGIYVVYVQDENDCVSMYTFMVNENTACNIVVTAFPVGMVTCSGYCNGTVGFAYNDVNDNAPYTVVLTDSYGGTQSQVFASGSSNSGSFANVCAGIYLVTVIDATGCQSNYSVQIVQPDYLQVNATQINATAGNTDGSITLTVSGGTAPYQFSADNMVSWQSSNVFSNLGAGFYIIYVKDANGCQQVVCFVLDDSNVAASLELSESLSVYPNPTRGLVFIESTQVQNVLLYDLSGQQLAVALTYGMNGVVMDFSELSSGVYFVQITTRDGKTEQLQIIRN